MAAPTCAVDGCRRKHHARGYCYTHYFRLWKTGSARAEEPIIIVGDDLRRWFSKVDQRESWMCWEWTGDLDRDGYGRFRVQGRESRGHIYAYEQFVGPVPQGKNVDHLCRVRSCCNPQHLEAVTPRTNTLRGTGISARNARKTHCDQGHPFDNANTYVTPRGTRDCRTCRREASRRYQARRAS